MNRRSRIVAACAVTVASVGAGLISYSISMASAATSAPEIVASASPAGRASDCIGNGPDIEHYRSRGELLPNLISFETGAMVRGDQNPCGGGDNGGDNGGGGGGGGGTPLDCSGVAPEHPLVGSISGGNVMVSTGGFGLSAPSGCSASIGSVTINAYACSTTTYSNSDCSASLATWAPFDCCTSIWGQLYNAQIVDPIESFTGKQYLILKIEIPVFNSGDSSNETVTAYSLARVTGTPPTATFQATPP